MKLFFLIFVPLLFVPFIKQNQFKRNLIVSILTLVLSIPFNIRAFVVVREVMCMFEYPTLSSVLMAIISFVILLNIEEFVCLVLTFLISHREKRNLYEEG